MENKETQIPIRDVLAENVNILNSINLPVSLIEQVGMPIISLIEQVSMPISRVRQNLVACIEALDMAAQKPPEQLIPDELLNMEYETEEVKSDADTDTE